ncbi:uncharacterized protein JN550_000479 [Neoarthrinium moseri]|uniref:uncharacterized protein n=1 Tax=Neoarthrinium moseri TaxID=1658444 RepID=UPI001FDB3C7A|nr:uncharacterized protein JN550_000479 [Neoarthrinium moseri]KAI1878297.1 hypothetical protein JN550_000479 [Neoarthrinium moseri]
MEHSLSKQTRFMSRERSPNPGIRVSVASSVEHDLDRYDHADGLARELQAYGLPDKSQLSPDDEDYSSSSDFVSIKNVEDFGFGASWSRQLQKYASSDHTPNVIGLDIEQSAPEKEQENDSGPNISHPSDADLLRIGEFLASPPPAKRASAQDFRAHLEKDLSEEVTVSYLERQLHLAQLDSKHDSNSAYEYFIPQDKLFTILSKNNVMYLFQHIFPDDSPRQIRDRVAIVCSENHSVSRRLILAVLIIIGKAHYIDDFLRHSICDINLPLRPHRTQDEALSRKNPFHRRQDDDSLTPLTVFHNWEQRALRFFLHTQYEVLAPFLEVGGPRVCFYKFDPKTPLPFLECTWVQNGGHGTVWRVKIHPAHHGFRHSLGSENPFFAVKAVHSKKYERYRDEVKVLERFSGSATGHPHLIRLFMAFKHGENYYLLFPWATGNLTDLWRTDPLPTRSAEKTRWLFDQCLGIADGLKKIHRHGSWPKQQRSGGHSQQEENGKDLGRHGDIKPENILCFDMDHSVEQRLVIADFGLTKFHSSQATSEITTPSNLRGLTRTYRPPEFSLEAPVSQKCDVWSLGCLYLEFITWYLVGFDKTRAQSPGTFNSLRLQDDDKSDPGLFAEDIAEDKFFNLYPQCNDGRGTFQYAADVKTSVRKWIIYLRGLEQCSEAIQDFLNLIEIHMLVPVIHMRADMRNVQRRLKIMADRCNGSDNYCTVRPLTTPDHSRPKAAPAIGGLRPAIHQRMLRPEHSTGADSGRLLLDTEIDSELFREGLIDDGQNAERGLGVSTSRPMLPNGPHDQPTSRRPYLGDKRAPAFVPQESTMTVPDSQSSRTHAPSTSATTPPGSAHNSHEDFRMISDVPRSLTSTFSTTATENSRERVLKGNAKRAPRSTEVRDGAPAPRYQGSLRATSPADGRLPSTATSYTAASDNPVAYDDTHRETEHKAHVLPVGVLHRDAPMADERRRILSQHREQRSLQRFRRRLRRICKDLREIFTILDPHKRRRSAHLAL